MQNLNETIQNTLKAAVLASLTTVNILALTLIGIPNIADAQTYYPYPYSTAYGYQYGNSYNNLCYYFNTDLQIGSSGAAVEALHNALAREGFNRSNSSYSPQTFNEETASLVSAFQEKYRSEVLSPLGYRNGTGYVGQYTRNKLNALYGNTGSNCSGNGNTNDGSISISISPQKSTFGMYEDITFTLNARNNSAYEKTLTFNSGCQTSYRIGVYDSQNNQICTLSYSNVRIPAYGTYTWTVIHRANTYNLSVGSYTLTGRVSGYGDASATIYIDGGYGNGSSGNSGTNYPRVVRPNGGEWLRRGSYEVLSWQSPSGTYYFQAPSMDVTLIPQNNSYPYTNYPYYNNYSSTCAYGATCAYDTSSAYYGNYNYGYPYQNQYYQYQSSYTLLQNTTLTSYNWYVGSTPNSWSGIPAGSYRLQVCMTGTSLCDSSDNYFTISN